MPQRPHNCGDAAHGFDNTEQHVGVAGTFLRSANYFNIVFKSGMLAGVEQ